MNETQSHSDTKPGGGGGGGRGNEEVRVGQVKGWEGGDGVDAQQRE